MEKFEKNKGFTIIELIVVIGILSILALISFPKINASGKKIMLNGRILWNDIRNIRYITMTQGISMRILFPSDFPDRYIIANGNNTMKTVYMDKGIEIYHNSDDNFVQFSLSGTSIAKSAGTIKVFDTKTERFAEITIVPCTGRILLKDKIFEGFTNYK